MAEDTDYTLQYLAGGLAPLWSRVMQFPDDATATAMAGGLLERLPNPAGRSTSMLVGRGSERQKIEWLGAWHLDDSAVWVPAAN